MTIAQPASPSAIDFGTGARRSLPAGGGGENQRLLRRAI